MINSIFYEEKWRKRFLITVTCIAMVAFFWYLSWLSIFGYRVIVQESFEEAMIPFGVLTALLSLADAIYWRDFNVDLDFFCRKFMSGGILGWVFVSACCHSYIYLFADHVIGYESEYEVTIPGPGKGKNTFYEAGIWINDQNTHRRYHLATTKAYLRAHYQQGATKVWVTARVNRVGSYIIGYEFICDGSCDPSYRSSGIFSEMPVVTRLEVGR